LIKFFIEEVKIEFTKKEMISYGGYCLLAEFFEKVGLKERVKEIVPIEGGAKGE
jgi:hypothetical protein